MPRVVGGPLTGPFAQVAAQMAEESLQRQRLAIEAARIFSDVSNQAKQDQINMVKLQQADDHWRAEQDAEEYQKGLDLDYKYQKLKSEADTKAADQYLRAQGIDVSARTLAETQRRNDQLAEQFRLTGERLAGIEVFKQSEAKKSREAEKERDELNESVKLLDIAVRLGQVPEKPGSRVFVPITSTHPQWEERQRYIEMEKAKMAKGRSDRELRFAEAKRARAQARVDRIRNEVDRNRARELTEEQKWLAVNHDRVSFPPKITTKSEKALYEQFRADMAEFKQATARSQSELEQAQKDLEEISSEVEKKYGLQDIPEPTGPVDSGDSGITGALRAGISFDVDTIDSADDVESPEFKAYYSRLTEERKDDLANYLRRKGII